MADVSADIIERIALGTISAVAFVVSGLGAWGFSFLNKKIDKLETDIDSDVLTLHKRLDSTEKTILQAIKDAGSNSVTVDICDAKQELWIVKTQADREANNKEHTVLVGNIADLKDAIKLIGESQVVAARQVSDELREVQECIKKLTKGLECD